MSTTVFIPADTLASLRELRLWHWEGVLYRRQAALFWRTKAGTDRAVSEADWNDAQANFHLKQVQVLNSFFPIGDSAADDLRKKVEI